MKFATAIGTLLGLALLVAVGIRADWSGLVLTLVSGGTRILWLLPYRAVFFLLYAIGWSLLLRPYDAGHRASLGYLFWVTSVREAVDRLLPVASVGGSVVGIRLVRWRGLEVTPIAATVIVEIVLTLIASYLFTALGLLLLLGISGPADPDYRRLLLGFALCLPVPLITVLVLRYGSVFERSQRFLKPLIGNATAQDAILLDLELRACLRRMSALSVTGALQWTALASGAFEVWFALRLFGHPVGVGAALVLESTTQALRHLAFIVPAGIGVQEAGLVIFGHLLGIDADLALAVSAAKRMRELLWGLPSLVSWQWREGRRRLSV